MLIKIHLDPQNEVVEPIPNTGVGTDNQHEDCPTALWSIRYFN